jgi:pSer/pThr/pTyr-binding forkhead associated (FHA) protein
MIVESGCGRRELLPIEKPQGSYLVLEGACEKENSVIVVQNVPEGGIILGRGRECEIRITDISVSRSHACIKMIDGGFYIFDCKSKFGTLVREEPMVVELDKMSRGIQVGRTRLIVQVRRGSGH